MIIFFFFFVRILLFVFYVIPHSFTFIELFGFSKVIFGANVIPKKWRFRSDKQEFEHVAKV